MQKDYSIELFDNKKHTTKEFSCGSEKLDRYIKEQAGQESKKKVAVIYVLRESDFSQIIGFYSLSACSIDATSLPENLTKKLPKYKALPAILLGRLAVDKRYQGKQIGKYLSLDALERSYNLSKQLGSFTVVVDAKDEKSRSFYEKYGFEKMLKHPFILYLPMKTIAHLVEG